MARAFSDGDYLVLGPFADQVEVYHDISASKLIFDAPSGTIYEFLEALEIGASGSALSFAQGSPLFALYATHSGTHASNSAEHMYVENTMTGAGAVGGRARFYMTTNVALGSWSNALKAHVVYGASGSTTGLGSAFVGELQLSAGTSSGTYCALEAEVVLPASASTGTATSFIYMAASGANVAQMDTAGYLFELAGLTEASGKLLYVNTGADPTNSAGSLRIRINGTAYYLMFYAAEAA